MSLEISPRTPLGADVAGLSPAQVSAEQVATLRAALAEHGVLAFSAPELDDDGFVTFLRAFGELAFTDGEAHAPGHPDLNVVSNVGRTSPPVSNWHVDTSYVREPPAYTALRAVQIPAHGGETLFANQYRAWETLSEQSRADLSARTITHVVTGVDPGEGAQTAAEHPVARPHPLTGRPALYLTSAARCAAVSGLDDAEAKARVAELLAHSTRPDNVLALRWAPGQVVMWDNGCVLHRADHSAVSGDRVMHRGMVAGYGAGN